MAISSPYFRLLRIYNAPFHGAIPLLGAIAMGYTSLPSLLLVFLVGILAHGFFSVTNEIMDVEEDRKMGNLRSHPLASGELPETKARVLGVVFPLLAVVLTVLFLPGQATLFFLLLSLGLFAMYNIVNKTLPGTELILASAFASLALFGCSAGGLTDGSLALLFAAAAGLHVLSILTIYMGLWLTQYRKEGIKMTLTHFLGARKRGDRFIPTIAFIGYGAILQVLFFTAILLPFLLNHLPYSRGQMVILLLLVLAAAMVTYRILAAPLYRSKDVAVSSVIHYMLVGAALPLMVAMITPWVMLLVIFPAIEILIVSRATEAGLTSPAMGTMPSRTGNMHMETE